MDLHTIPKEDLIEIINAQSQEIHHQIDEINNQVKQIDNQKSKSTFSNEASVNVSRSSK